jgi:hypothetical protein
MGNVLFEMMGEYSIDLVARLNEILEKHRISPRPTITGFLKLLRKLVPGIARDTVESLYRCGVTKGGYRPEISISKFIALFREQSVLNTLKQSTDQPAVLDESSLLSVISTEWATQKSGHDDMIDFFRIQCAREPDNLTLKTQYDEVVRFQSLLTHALSVHDEANASRHFYQLLFGLDLLMSISSKLRPQELDPGLQLMEAHLRENWIDRLYDPRTVQTEGDKCGDSSTTGD